MPEKPEKYERKLVSFFPGDIAALKRFYPSVGYNLPIREVVHAHVKMLLEQESRTSAEENNDFAQRLSGKLDLESAIKRGNLDDK